MSTPANNKWPPDHPGRDSESRRQPGWVVNQPFPVWRDPEIGLDQSVDPRRSQPTASALDPKPKTNPGRVTLPETTRVRKEQRPARSRGGADCAVRRGVRFPDSLHGNLMTMKDGVLAP
jgi:hypothetical protein